MNKSLLADVFRAINRSELPALEKWVCSPAVNLREDVVRLFKVLAEWKHHGCPSLKKEEVFAKLFPGVPYDDAHLRHVMSFLLQSIKRFFIWRELNGDEVQGRILLCRRLKRLGLERLFERELNGALEALEKQPLRNHHYHFLKYKLALERHGHVAQQRRSGMLFFQPILDELTNYYLSDLLRHACNVAALPAASAESFDLHLLPEALVHLQSSSALPSALAIYRNAYLALTQGEEGERHYRNLKKLLLQHWETFPPEEARAICLLAINYCIRRLNRGERPFIKEAFELFRLAIERNVLLENGRLSPFTYNNILMLALALKEFDWAFRFLQDYRPFLPENERENFYHYNLAVYHFRRSEYAHAMRLLQGVKLRDKHYNLNARRILLRIYFELGEFEALHSLLGSFSTYIRRQKDLGYHGEMYLNLIRFTRKLLRCDFQNLRQRAKIRTELENTPAVAEREWLLKQLEEKP